MLTNAYESNKEKQQQTVEYATPPKATSTLTSSTRTIEQKLDELNKLAAGVYITPQGYKARKQAILDTLIVRSVGRAGELHVRWRRSRPIAGPAPYWESDT